MLVYGALAELVYGHVQKGSRIGVEGHIQLRYRPNTTTPVFEVVAEKVEFLRNIDYERGKRVVEELKQRSKSRITAGPEREVINRILQSAEFAWDNEAADGG